MKKQIAFSLFAAGAVALSLTTATLADHHEAQMSPEQMAMMEAWMKAGTPGENHAALAKMAGTWETTAKSWDHPSAPPNESKGTSTNTMVLGGRYLEQRYQGDMMGMPFEGLGYTAYDNSSGKYLGIWMDNMSTAIMQTTGWVDPATKKLLFTGTMFDPGKGKAIKVEEAVTMVDDNHHIFEMMCEGDDGKMWKNMEIHYMRKP